MTSISFGENSQLTSIGDVAFYGCRRLKNVEIPSGVISIGEQAFAECYTLKSVRCLAVDVPSVGADVFYGVHSKMQIQVPEASIESYKTTEPWSNFTITKIYPYHYGESVVKEYEGYSLRFTANPVKGGAEVICETQPTTSTSITIPATIEINGTEFAVISIENYAFRNCSNLTSIEIPSGVTSIEGYAFDGCSSLTSISFGDDSQLTSIGANAFKRCYNLTSIEIPSGVTSIGKSAFLECRNLKSVSFGDNSQLASIGDYAFQSCSSLTSIEIPSGVTSIGNSVFSGCSKLKSLEIPKNVAEIGTNIISGCDDVETIIVDEENVVFDSRDNCNAIIKTSENKLVVGYKNTIIPSGVTSIGDYAFAYSNLTELVIPNGVTSIGNMAFLSSSLTNIEISNSVTSIGYDAFQMCNELVSVAFEEGSQLTSIGIATFYECSNLRTVELPSSITEIGNCVFSGCNSLTSINIPSGVTSIGEYAFQYCGLTSIEIPSGVTSIENGAFYQCDNLMNINFGNESQLTFIGESAFEYCYMLLSIEIPANVTTIGNSAFSGIRYIICRKETPIIMSGDLCLYDATIFVPESSVEDYEDTYPWNNYTILSIDPASVNVTVNDEEAGSVVGAGNYCKSMEIRLMATPNIGYDFVGWKEDGEIVSTDSEYYFTLYGDRTLEAVFELSKYWHPDLHLYPNTMNITTEVKVDGELQNSTLLEVGAFCEDELRGSGRIQYNSAVDKYIAYISVTGETDDQIKFKLNDHETYQELSYASLSILPFETNAIVGTVTEPYLTEFSSTARVNVTVNPSDAGYVEGAGDYPIGSMVSLKATNNLTYLFENWTINGEVVETSKTYNFIATESVNIKANFTCSQRTELSAGWNWTSFHTFIYGYNGLLAIELSLGDYGLHIKNQNSFVTNHNGMWYGSLTSVDVEQMYIIRVSDYFTLVLNGLVVNPENYQISLTKN